MWYPHKSEKPTDHPVFVYVDDQGRLRRIRFPAHPGLSPYTLYTIFKATIWETRAVRCSCIELMHRLSFKRTAVSAWYTGFDMPDHVRQAISARLSARVALPHRSVMEYAVEALDLYGASATFRGGTGRIHQDSSGKSYDFSLSLYGLCVRAFDQGIVLKGAATWDEVFPYRLVNDRLYAYLAQSTNEGKLAIVRKQLPSPLPEIRERIRCGL